MAKHYKRTRRKIDKRNVMLSTGKSANQAEIKSYNDRVKSIARGERVPPTRPFYLMSIDGENAMPRAIVLDDLKNNPKFNGYEKYYETIFYNSKEEKLSLFFSANRFFWLKENKKKQIKMRSIIYMSRLRAMDVWTMNKITWIETVPT